MNKSKKCNKVHMKISLQIYWQANIKFSKLVHHFVSKNNESRLNGKIERLNTIADLQKIKS